MKKVLFVSFLAIMALVVTSCDSSNNEEKKENLPTSLDKVTGLSLDANGILSWNAVNHAQNYIVSSEEDLVLVGPIKTTVCDNITDTKYQLPDNYSDKWLTLFVRAAASNEYQEVISEYSDPYECVWLKNKELLAELAVSDIEVFDTLRTNSKGEQKMMKGLKATISNIGPNVSSIALYVESVTPLSDGSQLHNTSMALYELDKLEMNEDKTSGTLVAVPASLTGAKGDVFIAFQANPSDENADKFISSRKTSVTIKL